MRKEMCNLKNWLMVFNFVALGCILVMLTTYYIQLDTMTTEYDTDRLSKTIEYAGDMAFNYALASVNNELAYEDMNQITLSPERCLPSFEEMMCLNYDMSICEDNLKYIEDSITTALLATNDGYYITLMSEVNGTGEAHSNTFEFNWSPKLPYTIKTYDDDNNLASEIAVFLGSERWIKVNANTMGITTGKTYADLGSIKTIPSEGGVASPSLSLNKETVARAINTRITNAITQNIDAISELRSDKDYSLYIPSEQTSSGLNKISSPSLIIIMKNVDFSGQAKVRNAQISGLKVVKKVRVIGYLDKTNKKKYCYESQIMDSTAVKLIANAYFDSVEKAAAAGFSPDYNYIFNKIDTTYKSK
jgi:hypothetical protein